MEFKYDLTIGMIVKNEEKILEKCLKSLEPLRKEINCELIITDTGSTDKTMDIAKKYADKVLEFEWCDDFSKARNIAVEASEGKWFMSLDADEIFDESITEISKFIKLPQNKDYNCATFVIRNFYDDTKNRYNDFDATRIYNFLDGKRSYIYKIHEIIPENGNKYSINAIAWHSGYHEDVFDAKRVRNRELLERELLLDNNNIRYIKQIMDISKDENEIIELADKAIALFKSNKAKHPEMILSIYSFITRMYLKKKNYVKAIEVADEFFEIEISKKKSLPQMEMAWLHATALLELGQNVQALRKFELYKFNYEYFSKNKNNLYASIDIYSTNKESIYHNSCLMIVECLRKIGEVNKANQSLESLDYYEYRDNNKEYYLLNLYLKNVVLLNNKKLFNKVNNFINKVKIDVYSNEKYAGVMIARLHFNNDINDFVKKCSKETFVKMFYGTLDSIQELSNPIQSHLVKKTRFVNLKECEYYTAAMYCYCINGLKRFESVNKNEKMKLSQSKMQNNLLSSGVFSQFETNKSIIPSESIRLKNQINTIFELLIKNNYEFLNKTQNIQQLKETGFDNIDYMQSMTIIVYEGLKNKENDVSSYMNSLKESIPYSKGYKIIIKFVIDLISEN